MGLIWTEEEYGTGNETIDQQHQALFDQINVLLEAIEQGGSEAQVKVLLQFLSGYIVSHFVYEERVMEDHRCAAGAANRAAHRAFVTYFTGLKERFKEEGITPGLTAELKGHMLDWVSAHIKGVDTHLRD